MNEIDFTEAAKKLLKNIQMKKTNSKYLWKKSMLFGIVKRYRTTKHFCLLQYQMGAIMK